MARSAIAAESLFGQQDSFRVTCSFGLTRVDAGCLSVPDPGDAVLAAADEAMYESKARGKNTVTLHPFGATDPD